MRKEHPLFVVDQAFKPVAQVSENMPRLLSPGLLGTLKTLQKPDDPVFIFLVTLANRSHSLK